MRLIFKGCLQSREAYNRINTVIALLLIHQFDLIKCFFTKIVYSSYRTWRCKINAMCTELLTVAHNFFSRFLLNSSNGETDSNATQCNAEWKCKFLSVLYLRHRPLRLFYEHLRELIHQWNLSIASNKNLMLLREFYSLLLSVLPKFKRWHSNFCKSNVLKQLHGLGI